MLTAGQRTLIACSCLVVEQGLDVGFAYDGDADRCLAVDERGHVVDGDLILYVCGVYLNKHGRLSADGCPHGYEQLRRAESL